MGAGFANLAAYDSNHDGVVDKNDAHFNDLMIWRDANGNHQTDAGELMSLSDQLAAAYVADRSNEFAVGLLCEGRRRCAALSDETEQGKGDNEFGVCLLHMIACLGT